jgi:hypothetical protein
VFSRLRGQALAKKEKLHKALQRCCACSGREADRCPSHSRCRGLDGTAGRFERPIERGVAINIAAGRITWQGQEGRGGGRERHLGCAHALAVVIDGEAHSHLPRQIVGFCGGKRARRGKARRRSSRRARRLLDDLQAKFHRAPGRRVPMEAIMVVIIVVMTVVMMVMMIVVMLCVGWPGRPCIVLRSAA